MATRPALITRNQVKARYAAQGEKVYKMPIDNSTDLGIPGYYGCTIELTKQAREPELPDACAAAFLPHRYRRSSYDLTGDGPFAHTAIKQPPDTRTVIEIFVIDLVSDERKDSIRPLAKAP